MATQEKRREIAVQAVKAPQKTRVRAKRSLEAFEPFFELARNWPHPLRWPRLFGEDLSDFEARIPSVDVIDRDDEIVVKAEVPGVDKEDIKVSIAGSVMTIKGETKREEREEKGDYYRCEISRGAFTRLITLPAEVDEVNAKAELRDGMLQVTLPKLEHAKKRDIKIQ